MNLKSEQSVRVKLRKLKKMIPFTCRMHHEERGVILMTDKEEKDLTLTERLRLLTCTANFQEEFWNLIKEMDDGNE